MEAAVYCVKRCHVIVIISFFLEYLLILLYPYYQWYIWNIIQMQIQINIDDPVPQFAQLIEQIKKAVQTGELIPGDALPSIRQLANDLGLNNKTVAKAYRLLERDSVIQTKGYRGTYIHPEAKANAAFDLSGLVSDEISNAIRACREAGATDSEIRIAFADAMQKHPL